MAKANGRWVQMATSCRVEVGVADWAQRKRRLFYSGLLMRYRPMNAKEVIETFRACWKCILKTSKSTPYLTWPSEGL